MDFFTNQDTARRKTKYLVVLFMVAVGSLICLANVLIAFCLWIFGGSTSFAGNSISDLFSWHLFGIVCFGVTAVVALAIAYKWVMIGGGGKSVAESLGGVRISPNSNNLQQQRLLNVVAEMALASGMPVPPVYLLAHENGINAFAAGLTPADAVIGITQGGLEQFSREQLQGVIAHEFSHILNGDMRLNMRLIALLNGILFIGGFGQFLMRSSSFSAGSSMRRVGSIRILAIGFAMALIGWLGIFFGGLIKAAINRQREFLADASAVQFTRNPSGIADALKIIGGFNIGSRVQSAAADEASHLFISNALGSFFIFDTHPPLKERISRLERGWDGRMIARKFTIPDGAASNNAKASKAAAVAAGVMVAGALGGALGQDVFSGGRDTTEGDGQSQEALAIDLLEKLKDPFSATAIIYALLLSPDEKVLIGQLEIITTFGAQGAARLASQIGVKLENIDPVWRMVIIEKSMPALKCMSLEQYKVFRKVIFKLIHADQKVELFEWCLFQLVRHYLGAEFGDQRPSKPLHKSINDVADEYTLVVSALVHHGHVDPESAKRAFARGANSAGLYNSELLAKPQCTMESFMKAVNKLADCYPLLKSRLIKGLVNTAGFDDKITATENELITSIAAVMDCPIPRLQLQ